MENNLTAPQTSAATDFQKVVALDAKLTRQEAMDLLMDDLLKEMKQELARAEVENSAANRALRDDLTLDDVTKYLPAGKVRIASEYSTVHNKYVQRILVEVPLPQDDAKIQAMLQRASNAEASRASISSQIYRMESSKSAFKSTVLRNMLNSTPEGQAALAALTNIKLAIKTQFLSKQEG